MPKIIHLSKRFFNSLFAKEPSEKEIEWVKSFLNDAEFKLWMKFNKQDKSHTIDVSKGVVNDLNSVPVDEDIKSQAVAAALLHDCGKIKVPYGTFRRVFATLFWGVVPDSYIPKLTSSGRFINLVNYRNHPEIGYEFLKQTASGPIVLSWTREHHLNPSDWTIESSIATILDANDND